MNKTKEIRKLIRKTWGRTSKHLSYIWATLFWIPEIHPRQDYVITASMGLLRVCLPLDRSLYQRSKDMMTKRGWKLRYETKEHETNHYPSQRYEKRGVRIDIAFFDHIEGSTCKRVKIGTKEAPVYEFRCEETV